MCTVSQESKSQKNGCFHVHCLRGRSGGPKISSGPKAQGKHGVLNASLREVLCYWPDSTIFSSNDQSFGVWLLYGMCPFIHKSCGKQRYCKEAIAHSTCMIPGSVIISRWHSSVVKELIQEVNPIYVTIKNTALKNATTLTIKS